MAQASNPSEESPFLQDWGFTLRDLYNLSVDFFKEKQGKAVHFTYEERIQLLALVSQVSHGKLDNATAPPVGVLDVVGKDRRVAWQALGDKSKAGCMFDFITKLNNQCPLFKPFVEAHKRDLVEKERIKQDETDRLNASTEESQASEEEARKQQEEQEKQEEQKRRIQDALNRQTFAQFKTYAEQQFPANPEQQAVLIRQLQEQHYEQYMRQVYQQQFAADNPSSEAATNEEEGSQITGCLEKAADAGENGPSAEQEHDHGVCRIADASMWTRKDIKEFKESVRAEGGEAILRVNQGESVTVRVPTHEDGSCLFWEFATDSYDIGFGLFFEWTDVDEPVSIQIVEENSSEDDDEDDETLQSLAKDVEKGRELLPKGAKPNTDIIIPVYRRDAQTEVYVGSHLFPGKGVYLLKFDNSYSFWRSKTLYYRVYYTK